MSERIPDEAIEAGAKALGDDAWLGHDEPLTGDDLTRIATVALTAALPHLHPAVETVEELDALPDGTVILSKEGDAWKRSCGRWYFPGLEPGCDPWYIEYALPATVLHMGDGDVR